MNELVLKVLNEVSEIAEPMRDKCSHTLPENEPNVFRVCLVCARKYVLSAAKKPPSDLPVISNGIPVYILTAFQRAVGGAYRSSTQVK